VFARRRSALRCLAQTRPARACRSALSAKDSTFVWAAPSRHDRARCTQTLNVSVAAKVV
jgi:hypothetical protein